MKKNLRWMFLTAGEEEFEGLARADPVVLNNGIDSCAVKEWWFGGFGGLKVRLFHRGFFSFGLFCFHQNLSLCYLGHGMIMNRFEDADAAFNRLIVQIEVDPEWLLGCAMSCWSVSVEVEVLISVLELRFKMYKFWFFLIFWCLYKILSDSKSFVVLVEQIWFRYEIIFSP